MDQIPELAMRWWRQQDDAQRRRATAVALCGLAYLIHYAIYCIPQPFFIEDAAISYTYAKHLVEGEGLVTYPGGERVEGYSNALWTLLCAGFYALGMPMWTAAKLMGAVFGAMTLPIVYALTRRMRPEGSADVALLAPLLLALHPSFVVWNALFCLLLAGSSLRLIVESEDPSRRQWSALGFFLLTMTRPEGVMYAALGAIALVLYSVADRKPLRVLSWLLIFSVPFALYNGWRYWYFAWELPNTYYAKLGVDRFHPYSWNAKGWKYIKNYTIEYGIVFGLPLLFFALGGGRELWRRRLSVGLIAALALLIFWSGAPPRPPSWWPEDGPWPEIPEAWHRLKASWVRIRVWSIAATAALMGLVTLTWPGWRARGLLWCHCTAGVFFALYSGGDWMSEWRWFNIVSISLIPLLCVGLGEVLDALVDDDWMLSLPRLGLKPARWVFLAAVALPFLVREGQRGVMFALSPETAVRDIHRRVYYMHDVQRQLDLDHVTLLDVDMGAHIYFSGWDIVDIAGLVDVPMARHSDFNRDFILEYIFEERKPDFAHVHAGWARQSKIDRQRPWKKEYLEIPAYPLVGRQLHVGNHIRRDLFIEPFASLPPGAVSFTGEVQLLSHALPSAEVAPGGQLHLRTWWRAISREDGFRVIVWLDDGAGHRTASVVEPGYGWYPPEDWKVNEQVAGRFWIPIPQDLPLGHYRIGMALMDEATGEILQVRGEEAATESESVYIEGELQLPETIQIVSEEEATSHAQADHDAAIAAAAAGDCEQAWPHFKNATRHLAFDEQWRTLREEGVRAAIALCYLRRADGVSERDEKIPSLLEARRWDHRAPGLAEAIRPIALDLDVQGDARGGQGDWEGAYRAWDQALALEPSRSWTRRKAEEARDKRLGITRPGGERLPPKPRQISPPPRPVEERDAPVEHKPDPEKGGEI
ncbi:MAG: hypothetical protein ACI8S6_001183 [Myxococcota bacterium]|jgi:hypothetical protein